MGKLDNSVRKLVNIKIKVAEDWRRYWNAGPVNITDIIKTLRILHRGIRGTVQLYSRCHTCGVKAPDTYFIHIIHMCAPLETRGQAPSSTCQTYPCHYSSWNYPPKAQRQPEPSTGRLEWFSFCKIQDPVGPTAPNWEGAYYPGHSFN